MTIRQRISRSNIAMFAIPLIVVALMLAIGAGLTYIVLEKVYLPQAGLSFELIHHTLETMEDSFSGLVLFIGVYSATIVVALVTSIVLTNIYLTRNVFDNISKPIDELVKGVRRINDGNLENPIEYELDDEFKDACDALDDMALRLKDSLEKQQMQQQRKQELIVGLSHDLKSPLTSIRAYTEAMLDGMAKTKDVERKYLNTILKKESDIESIVGKLFDYAKMDEMDYPLEMKDLELKSTLETIAENWRSDAITIGTDDIANVDVIADFHLLKRALDNIIGNSILHGGKTPINMEISAKVDNDMVEILLADDGIGVKKEQLDRIFDFSYKSDSSRTAPNLGSGIGLSVVRKSIEMMGGSVYAKETEHGGLTIVIRLKTMQNQG